MCDFLEVAKRRQASRGFSDQPVEHEKLVNCAEAARLAPSGCNAQPWSFVVVETPEKVAEVAKCSQQLGMNGWTDTAKAFVIVFEEHAVLMPGIRTLVPSQFFAKTDMGGAVLSVCLEAETQGLGSCILGVYDREKICEIIGVPVEKQFGGLIAIGYPANPAIREKSRKSFDDVVTFV